MKKNFSKLINVKSIVTLVLTGVFAYLATISKVSAENFMTIFTVIIAFYFGTQSGKATAKSSSDGGADGE